MYKIIKQQVMIKLLNHYKKLNYDKYYDIILTNITKNDKEFIQVSSFLNGIKSNVADQKSDIDCNVMDSRIDLPVWFGNINNAKKRIIVFGLEPRDTNSNFNVEKVGKNVFATPFGIDRWNAQSSIKYKPQNKYYRVFQDVITNNENFILFSDIVKDYQIISKKNENRKNDKTARELFFKKATNSFSFLQEEISIINPTHIITLGIDSYEFLRQYYNEITIRLRHPSNGGEKIAIEELKKIFN
jgi:hypothetical protein